MLNVFLLVLSYEQRRLHQQHAAAAIPAHEMGPHSAYKRPRMSVDVRPELTQPLRIDTRGGGAADDKPRMNLYKAVIVCVIPRRLYKYNCINGA